MAGDSSFYLSVQFRHIVLNRNKRCLLAYLHNRIRRLRQMRWEFGSILPPEVNANLVTPEIQWFHSYSKALATYMRSIGENHGLNLTMDVLPPKSLYIEVRNKWKKKFAGGIKMNHSCVRKSKHIHGQSSYFPELVRGQLF